MTQSTVHNPDNNQKRSSTTQIEERFQAGLQLQGLYALPIYQLPTETILNILHHIEIDDYPALIASTWHLLRIKGVAPPLTTDELKELLLWPRLGFFNSIEHVTDSGRDDYLPCQVRRLMISHLAPPPPFFTNFTNVGRRLRRGVPKEVWDLVFVNVSPEDKINVTLAAFRFSDRHIEWLTHQEV